MTALFTTTEDVLGQLTRACEQCGITVGDTAQSIIYTTAADPRTALIKLQEFLWDKTAFRERSTREGDEEAYLTVLDITDRTTTIKIRRTLPR